MRRRTVLGLATTLLAAPPTLFAQASQRTYRLAVFQFNEQGLSREHMRVLRERLKQLGFAEGRNLQVTQEPSSLDAEVRRQSADKLIRTKPDVILSFGSTNTRVVQSASTGRIPVVFTIVGDPVAYGLVKELGRPGSNTTGVTFLQRELTAKRLELVRDLLPNAKKIVIAAYLGDVTYIASESLLREIAGRLRLQFVPASLTDTEANIVATAVESGADALFVYQPMSFVAGLEVPERIAQLAMARRIPVFFAEADLVARGGLLSYGPDFLDETRRAADMVAKVLGGANAGDIPIDQSTRFELVVNVKTAKNLGVEIPQSVRPRITRIVQ